jgi:septal ring factor EnvC (AmiA/AmiB activator)
VEAFMSNQILNAQIRALTAALSQTSSADAETRGLLQGLLSEIVRVADQHPDTVTDRLEAIAVRFEADHPAVGTAIRQAIDALSKAGI